jgi:hypothetical protein
MQSSRGFIAASALVLLASGCAPARGQSDALPTELNVPRNSGDSLQPVFDGWQRYPDGTIGMWFGYLNRNYKEQLDIPIGPNNGFAKDSGQLTADQGQPTHFYPRRHQYVFRINVPKDWGQQQKLIWTLTANGETGKAIGSLEASWEVDDGVRMMNHGGAGLAPPEVNEFPKITSGSKDQTTELGKPVTLSVAATDDGIPKPRAGRGGGGGGLEIQWFLYRGPGQVTFKPQRTAPVYGKPVESSTEASFSAPGEYWLQATASDGLLETVHNVKVTVKK